MMIKASLRLHGDVKVNVVSVYLECRTRVEHALDTCLGSVVGLFLRFFLSRHEYNTDKCLIMRLDSC